MRLFTALILLLAAGSLLAAPDLYIYPKNGQSEKQQKRDRYECHVWAADQTGFDPSKYEAPQRVVHKHESDRHDGRLATDPVTGAAQGAAVGAVGGAIGGDAGKGAAIGAGVGALLGAFNTLERESNRKEYQRRKAEADQQAAAENLRKDYNRAISACLEARGYTVK